MGTMGRKRQTRKDLPRRMYFHHGAYYFFPKNAKALRLSADYGEALVKYAAIVQPVATARQTLSDVMDVYIRAEVPKKRERTRTDYLDAIARLRPVFGGMWPEDLRPKHVYQYLTARGAPTRANREVAVLSNVMNQAVRLGLVDVNPCRQVRRNEENPRTREVLDGEISAFLLFCPHWLQVYVELKLMTGLRQGDMLKIGLFNIRDDGLFVETGKRQKRLLFQWTDALRETVVKCKALRRKPSESRFFVISTSGFKSAWARAMKAYGKESFAENDLRAKVASMAVDKGMDAATILGHSSDAVTRRHYIRGTRKVTPMR